VEVLKQLKQGRMLLKIQFTITKWVKKQEA